MITRRRFLEETVKVAAFSSIALSPGFSLPISQKTKVRIGIIGAENSHTRGFGKLFNIDMAFPGVEVKYVWGETEAFARDAMARGGIPKMVSDPRQMLGKIDAVIVDHRHGKYHLNAARPFIEAGIPAFIDKPFCYRLGPGKEFLAMAREHETPVTSYSSIAHSHETFDMIDQLKEKGRIDQVVMYGPLDIFSEYGSVFFYGPHLVETMQYLFGDNIKKVRITKNGNNSGANLVYDDGRLVTFVFTTKKYGWNTYIETEQGIEELNSSKEAQTPGKNDVDMVEMFKTGKEPRSHISILKEVAILEALERSVASEKWELVEEV